MTDAMLLSAAVLVFAAACARSGDDRRDSALPPAAAADTGPVDSTWSVHSDHVGPVRIGMTAAEARRALGLPADTISTDGCSYLDGVDGTRLHANVMLTSDTVVRFDVLDSTLATAEGARVGDTEDQIRRMYGNQISVQRHKYLPNGHYLVVTTARDTANRIVFETDGKIVTRYRAGRTPEVELVEGCG